ncbi:helix-turn-helix domain-containing protein [Erysipelothrix rhusiopathiae]|uniref:helix-turn-helix domain-containing protein n=1 Tax=Erysipelothrix rhusiopathiae TaxID=1648 RepID=UPI003F46C8ED
MIINQQIKFYRTEQKMSQDMLAEKLNISRQSISKWERGESLPSIDNLVRLSEILGIPLDELVKGKESFPIPFSFGQNTTKVFFVIFVLITTLVCFVTYTMKPHLIVVLLAFGYCYGMVSLIGFRNFKDYYDFFIIWNQGIEVYVGTNLKLTATILSFIGKRKTKQIPYASIESMKIYFNNKGYDPATHEGLNYRRRQTVVGRETFSLILTTEYQENYTLNLDRLFYPQSDEYKCFSAMMAYFEKQGIEIDDVYGILAAITDEYDLIEAAYRKQ